MVDETQINKLLQCAPSSERKMTDATRERSKVEMVSAVSHEKVTAAEQAVSQQQDTLPGVTLSESKRKVIKLLQSDLEITTLMPAQDYHDGKLFYTVIIKTKKHLISSKGEPILYKEAEESGIALAHKDVNLARFSPEGIIRFLEDRWDVNVGRLYRRVHDYICRFVFFVDARQGQYLALWVMGTYLFRVFHHYPYVWVNAEKGSGKSLLLEILASISFNGQHVVNPTEATIFRTVHADSVTLCLDEIESLRDRDKDVHGAIMGILKSGFCKSGSVQRTEGANGCYKVKSYSTYSPKVMAGINQIDDVLQDRTVRIALLKKKESEKVERFRNTKELLDEQKRLRDDLYCFALGYAPSIAKLYEESEQRVSGLEHLSNRERDIWEPVFVLANVVEGSAPELGILDDMVAFSRQSGEYKRSENASVNETGRLLSVLLPMLEDLPASITEGEGLLFEAKSVFEYFQKTDEFSWMKYRNVLTTRLKKVNVSSEQRREKGRRDYFYKVSPESIRDLAERFGVDVDAPEKAESLRQIAQHNDM